MAEELYVAQALKSCFKSGGKVILSYNEDCISKPVDPLWNADAYDLGSLTLIEEIEEFSPEVLKAAHRQAREWLANSQSPDIKLRLADVACRVLDSINTELSADQATQILLTEPGGLRAQLEKHERVVIKRALAEVDGRVTHAASLLEMRYQSLAYIIERRHPDLLKKRTPIRRRQRQRKK